MNNEILRIPLGGVFSFFNVGYFMKGVTMDFKNR